MICICISVLGFAQDRITIKHGPYLQNLKETEVTVVWMVGKPSVGWVELAPDDNSDYYQQERPKYFDSTNGVKNTSLLHAVKITGLTPGTKYRYRVYSQEVLDHQGVEVMYGKVAATDVYGAEPLIFTTNDRNKPETSFVMINDIHGRTDDIPQLLKVADYKNTDMVIFNGDMLSQLKNEEELLVSWMYRSICLPRKRLCIMPVEIMKPAVFSQLSSSIISHRRSRICISCFARVRSVIFSWIQVKINRIRILNIVA